MPRPGASWPPRPCTCSRAAAERVAAERVKSNVQTSSLTMCPSPSPRDARAGRQQHLSSSIGLLALASVASLAAAACNGEQAFKARDGSAIQMGGGGSTGGGGSGSSGGTGGMGGAGGGVGGAGVGGSG